jgi:hypothetical protein
MSEIILFVSSTSQKCMPILQLIESFNLNITIVRLDTKEMRDIACNGPYSVTEVPTLFVVNQHSPIDVFVGSKVMPLIASYLKSIQAQQLTLPQSPMPTSIPQQNPLESGLYGPRKKSSKMYTPEIEDPDEGTIIEQPEEEEPPRQKMGKRRKKKIGKHSKKQQQGGDDGLMFIDDPEEEQRPDKPKVQSMKGLMMNNKNNESKMKSTLSQAAAMAEQWKKSMAFKENRN